MINEAIQRVTEQLEVKESVGIEMVTVLTADLRALVEQLTESPLKEE